MSMIKDILFKNVNWGFWAAFKCWTIHAGFIIHNGPDSAHCYQCKSCHKIYWWAK